ncbi:VIT domain-containing protein [Nannocystaceae bacterium ST9]
MASRFALVLLVFAVLACIETATPNDPDALVSATHARLRERVDAREDPRPIRLRSRDGTDLPLVRLEVRGTVEDPLAFTELHLDFENPEPRPLDATLRVELPVDARVTRFAALIEGSWREAEVVERKPGQLRPSLFDPATPCIDPEPEPSGTQRFEVVLPELPGRSIQKLVLSYAETFTGDDDMYRLSLTGLREVPRFSARVVLHGQADPLLADYAGVRQASELATDERGKPLIDLVRYDWTPTDDLVVPTSGLRRTGVRHGRKVAARINPLTHDHAAPIGGLTILFDTSASRAVGYAARIEQLAALIEALQPWTGGETWLRLIAFDQGFETIHDGPIGELERGAFERLRKRRALGASNLVSVLRHTAARRGPRVDRVILISDGQATAGVQDRSVVLDTVRELADGGVRRIDVIADAGERDAWLLRNLVRQLPESGLVLQSDEGPRRLVRRLVRTVHDDVRISVPGARWFYPEVVHGVQSDDEILVYADVETLDGTLRVSVESHGKQTLDVPLTEVEEPLVDWALAAARVEFLVATLEEKSEGQSLVARQQLWRRIVTTSRDSRVVNAYTRLAMLADTDDYDRARLDPAALPGVLFAGPDAVQRRVRGIPNALLQPEVPLARTRLPRFEQDTLTGEQLLLLADDRRARESDEGDPDPELLESDLELLVGDVEGPPLALDDLLVDDPPRSRVADPVEVELARLRRARPYVQRGRARAEPPRRDPDDAYHGNLLAVMNLLEWGKVLEAKQVALAWREAEPTEVMAVVALGEALEANAEIDEAARAYGSIIDLHPDRADMRRFAGSRLEPLGSVGGRLAIDSYRRAREQRPDHPSSHRLLAFALLRAGRDAQAFQVLESALERDWSSTFPGVEKVLREDLGLAAAAWIRREPEARDAVQARLDPLGAEFEREPSLRFVLTWETGANDVDLHVRDALGSHAYYDNRALRTGGVLYYDVTEGWGPEVFTILGEPTGYPYNLQVHYYARGPNGYGMGKLQIVEHDGSGRIEFDERPFVVMKDRAYVDLGDLEGPLGKR